MAWFWESYEHTQEKLKKVYKYKKTFEQSLQLYNGYLLLIIYTTFYGTDLYSTM